MRARLTMKLVSLVVMVVFTAFAAHAMQGSGAPAAPSSVLRNGVSGACADLQASQDAGGAGASSSDAPLTVATPGELAQAGAGAGALLHAVGGSLQCPTTTTSAP